MKKITVMLSVLVLFTAGNLFAQIQPTTQMSLNFGNIKYNRPVPLPATKDTTKVKAIAIPAKPAPAAKPKPATKIAQPKPGTKANDRLVIEHVKRESKNQ